MSELEKYLKNYGIEDLPYVHQKDAIEWMFEMCKNRKSCLLADEMGLGKTLDICLLFQITLPRIALVISPTSCVFSQWIRNLCKYSTFFKVYHLISNKVTQYTLLSDDTLMAGYSCFLHELHYDQYPNKIIVTNFNGVAPYPSVASRNGMTGNKYELSRPLDQYDPEITPLNSTIWDMVVCDEVHNIGNGINTRLDPKDIRDKQLRFTRLYRLRMNPLGGIRIGLTGTPIQNRISDVVSILTWLGVKFSPYVTPEEVKEAIKNFMFRRTSEDLHPILRSMIKFPELPYEEISKDVIYETELEADIYRIVAGKLVGMHIPGASQNPYSQVQYEENPPVRTMRECYLSADINMFVRIHNNAHPNHQIPYWHGTQSKMNMIVNDIVDFSMNDISFVCFIHFYDERAAVLQKMYEKGTELGMGPTLGYQIFDINGEIKPEERDIVLFRTKQCIESGIKCICFATIASSSDGLNMQHFNTAIITTSDYNPQKENQCFKRIHRIGQKRYVRIYRYIHRYVIDAEGTKHIDLKKIDRQNMKIGKFKEYIGNTPNAAHEWPIRDVPGFEGEKSVIFKNENNYDESVEQQGGLGFWKENNKAVYNPEPLINKFYEEAGRGKGQPNQGMIYLGGMSPVATGNSNISNTIESSVQVDIFNFNKYQLVYSIMREYFQELELYLRTAIIIDYLYNYNLKDHERDIFIQEIKTGGKDYIITYSEVFETEHLLRSWFQHFAPDKLMNFDNILIKYINCESELFNRLYRKYVDPEWQNVKLWFYNPQCEIRIGQISSSSSSNVNQNIEEI